MKSFLEVISEELTDEQKSKVNKWPRAKTAFSDHAMGKKDRIVIPLNHDDPVKDHLETNGFAVDRSKGVAIDKHNRALSIGKALSKTKAHPDLMLRHNRDTARKVDYSGGIGSHEIVISRHPHDIAGASTGRSWNSCMNMDGGEFHDHLRDDVEHGSHIAYLVKKGDHDIKDPIARTTLKPFTNEKGHKILRPENRSYGSGGDAFSSSVRKWSETHFPAKDKAVYAKNEHVYDDDGVSLTFNNTPETHKHIIKNYSYDHDLVTSVLHQTKDPKLINGVIDKAIETKRMGTIPHALNALRSAAPSQHKQAVDSLYSNEDTKKHALKDMDSSDPRIDHELSQPKNWKTKADIANMTDHLTPARASKVLGQMHDDTDNSQDSEYEKRTVFSGLASTAKGPEFRDTRIQMSKHKLFEPNPAINAGEADRVIRADIDDLGTKHSPVLKAAVNHSNPGVQSAAIHVMGGKATRTRMDLNDAVEANHYDLSHPKVKAAAAEHKNNLAGIKDHSETLIKQHYNDTSPKSIDNLQALAANSHDPDHLVKLAQHPNQRVSNTAKSAIERHSRYVAERNLLITGDDSTKDPHTGHDWSETSEKAGIK